MTFRPMAALAEKQHRLPEAGRVRLGIQIPTRNGKTRPEKLRTLRFTSANRDAIDQLAKLYGGTVAEWNDGWEVVTEAHEVPVVLPTDDPLGNTPIYELWNRGGLARRCDGEQVTCPKRISDDEVEMAVEPCICNARKVAECKVTVRLSVILPEVPFGGTWRVETHSWNAADEIPGMVDAIRAFAQRGFVRAYLGVRFEERMEAGKKKEFTVPYLRLAESVSDVLAGGATLEAIPAGPERLAIGSGLVPVVEAKQKLLVACGGDRGRALELWADRGSNDISEAELNRLIDAALPACEQDPEVVDAEVIDEWGAPF